MPDDLPLLLTPKSAGERLGVHRDTVVRWAKSAALPSLKTPGGHYRFRPADVDAFAVSMQDAAAPQDAA